MHEIAIYIYIYTGWPTKFLSCESSYIGKTIYAVFIKFLHNMRIDINGIVLKAQVSKFNTFCVIIMFV